MKRLQLIISVCITLSLTGMLLNAIFNQSASRVLSIAIFQ